VKTKSVKSELDRAPAAQNASRVTTAAFSLIEIMVTIALLSFIVLGLLAMFNQTQRAFRSSMTQVDVLEAGRAVTDLIARDMEQMVPTHFSYALSSSGQSVPTINFFAALSGLLQEPVLQGLPGTQENRTNVFQNVFFVGKQGQDYITTGYQVRPDNSNGLYGTLYRFAAPHTKSYGTSTNLSVDFLNAASISLNGTLPRNFSRIADGVVHFRVRCYDTNGFPFEFNNSYTNAMYRTNGNAVGLSAPYQYSRMGNASITAPLSAYPDQLNYFFYSNAVPAYVELEIGFLEPHILDRLKGIGNGTPATLAAQAQYLSNHVANVHLFRRRIPIRNVDFLAYR
jgi:hypothetical protein